MIPRRRGADSGKRGAAALALLAVLLGLAATPAAAQIITPGRVDTTHLVPGQQLPRREPQFRSPSDTGRARAPGDTTQDTSKARGGIPKGPTRALQAPDSVITDLMHRPGYRVTRYDADSVQLLARQKEIRLSGHALVDREGTQLEADTVRYQEGACELFAVGGPKLFDRTGTVIGEGMHYDACNHAGIIQKAGTEFSEGGANWFLRGDIAVDNTMNREYLSGASITSCDLPDPHYHFAAREVKYVSKRLMVSRPAVLYVADVPVLWLPFIFQDMRRGRRSGILTPQFGINDIVRTGRDYHRHISNIGYYWALSDYADAQAKMDWYAANFLSYEGRIRYRWLDRFMTGGFNYQELHELATTNGLTGITSGGGVSRRITWSHQQQFNLNTQLNASVDYASSSQIISRNAVDPVLAVATIDSRVNFTKRYDWGTFAMGGSRTQSLDKPLVTMTAPNISFTPNPVSIAGNGNVVWSPSFSLVNSLQNNLNQGQLFYNAPALTAFDTVLNNSRTTSISFSSPIRIGRWNWPNNFSVIDAYTDQRFLDTIFPDTSDRSNYVIRTFDERYSTQIDWSTGIALPTLFQGTWNLAPAISIVNRTGGPFLLRNQFTNGWVTQGKRLGYSLSVSPTFFGRFGGIGPIAAIRHAISPSISWNYAPPTTIPYAYAYAQAQGGRIVNLSSPATQAFSIGLSQNFEAKLKPPPRPPGDTTRVNPDQPVQARKIRLLSIQSSGFSFDVEQAKQPFRTAWQTDQFTNTFSSDLLRGFSLSTSHDLWIGPPGFTNSKFSPTLTSVAAGFQVGAGTIRALGALLGLHQAPAKRPDTTRTDTTGRDTAQRAGMRFDDPYQRGPLATRYSAIDRLAPSMGGGSFTASLTFNLQNPRLDSLVTPAHDTAIANQVVHLSQAEYVAGSRKPNEMLAGSMSFRPTPHWNLSWQTAFNITTGQFSDHVLRLDRDLHDWRATFTFVKSPNGNFLFSFFIQLIDQPEIKFDYDQRNLR